ncbi:MAG TPA: hypothetical protein VFJ82_14515 [Longimicrobium sp.]|nr:hypothetical protein [Longimicrobium sp.]
MAERRYTDEEVHAILARAAESDTALVPGDAGGWTLAEIQKAGTEAGMASSAIALAAAEHDRNAALAPREPGLLGLPLSVGRAVPLRRPLTGDEWRRLVSEMRQTFAAEGRERVEGDRREWRNGNLRIVHEPTSEGAFLELRTRKGDTRALVTMGGVMTLTSIMAAGANLLLATGNERGLVAAALMAAVGIATSAAGALRLPGWARRRTEQFDALGALARRLAGE